MKSKKGLKSMRLFSQIALCALSLSLIGCDMYEPGITTQKRAQVKEAQVSQNIALDGADEHYMRALASHYQRHGGSPLELTLTYDPASGKNASTSAINKLTSLKTQLSERGVTNVQAKILPVNAQGDDARLLVAYQAYSAHAPEGCDRMMPGMQETAIEADRDYELGCSVQSLIAKQVARPADLMGRGASDDLHDGRPATNIVDIYRTGAENEPLAGEMASEE